MSPPQRQSVAQITAELGIHVVTLYSWRKAWRLQGEGVPASQKDPEGWGAADKFTVVLETIGLNATELGGYCRERGLFPEQVDRWRQAAQDANAHATDDGRSEGPPKAAAGGPAGDQAAATGGAPQGESSGGGGCTADRLKKDSGLLGRGRGRLTSPDAREAAGTWHTALVGRNASGSC